MSYTTVGTYIQLPKSGGKRYFKDQESDDAFGWFKKSAFVNTSEAENEKAFLQHSYENEIHFFVEKLLNGMKTVSDEDGEIEQYIFEDEERFDERHLLWACFDLLIKADLTIKQIKKERMELIRMSLKSESEVNNE